MKKDTGFNICSHNVPRHVKVDADKFALLEKGDGMVGWGAGGFREF